jgi:hypothetical protein
MAKGRMNRTRKNGATKSKGGRRQKDYDGHSVPGQDMSDSKPGMWPARTGYTSQSRLGPGKHGVPIKAGKYGKM